MRIDRTSPLLLSFIFVFFFVTTVLAQVPNHSVRYFRQVAISPDGNRVAWVEPTTNDAGVRVGSAIYIQDLKLAGAKPHRIFPASGDAHGDAHNDQEVVWAPDSQRLAFLSDAETSGQYQLYVADATGDARKLTSLKGFLSEPSWSPDGTMLAFLFTEDAPRAAGPLQEKRCLKGQKGHGAVDHRAGLQDQRIIICI